jgi:hypothetical protein
VAYGLYAVMALLSFLFVLKVVRETKGRELEDMGNDDPYPADAAGERKAARA